MLSAGARVRVASPDGSSARRALLLTLASDTSTCEVEYDGGEEESDVASSRVTPLLEFELASAAPPGETQGAYADRCKVQGNALFKRKDLAAAAEMYTSALRALQSEAKLSTGGRCLVKPAEGDASRGGTGSRVRAALVMILDDDDGTADLLYEATSRPPLARLAEDVQSLEEGDDDEAAEAAAVDEEEDGVPVARLIPIHATRPALQCALCLNLARCSLQVRSPPLLLARRRCIITQRCPPPL